VAMAMDSFHPLRCGDLLVFFEHFSALYVSQNGASGVIMRNETAGKYGFFSGCVWSFPEGGLDILA